jgi:iron complex outermembrane recepter protein
MSLNKSHIKFLCLALFFIIAPNFSCFSKTISDTTINNREYKSEEIIVTDEKYQTIFDIIDSRYEKRNSDLYKTAGISIADYVRMQANVSLRSLGSSASRPVFRGQSGYNVSIIDDGFLTTDLSATSDDHAIAIDAATIESINLISGTSLIKYTNSLTGAAIDVKRESIPESVPQNAYYSLSNAYKTVNNGYTLSGKALIPFAIEPVGKIAIISDIALRRADDFHSTLGKIENTYINNRNLNIGGRIEREKLDLSFGVRNFYSDYGIPGGAVGTHPFGVDIEMFQRNYFANLGYDFDSVNNIQLNLKRTFYTHSEFEQNDILGAYFALKEHSLGIDFTNNSAKLKFESGINASFSEYTTGGFVFTPNTDYFNIATYFLSEFSLGEFHNKVGLRYSHVKYFPDSLSSSSRIGDISEKSFDILSVSFTSLFNIFNEVFVGTSIGLSNRAPSVEELYSNGPHLAAYYFEVGNPNLKNETAMTYEFLVNNLSSRYFWEFKLFYYDIHSNIISASRGDTNWASLLPIFERFQANTQYWGFQFSIDFLITENVRFRNTTGVTYSYILDFQKPAPLVPPLKSNFDLAYINRNLNFGITAEIADSQTRLHFFESPTPAYSIFGSYIQYLLPKNNFIHIITLSANNLFNSEYYNHLSKIKSIKPEPGRNIRMHYSIKFIR